jgi:phospholipid-translocating ATPase
MKSNNENNNNNSDDNNNNNINVEFQPLIGDASKFELSHSFYTSLAAFLKINPDEYEQTRFIPWHQRIRTKIERATGNPVPGTHRRWVIPNEKTFDPNFFPNNCVDNRRYSGYTFVFRSLLDQFRFSIYNIYFLLLALSQMVGELRVGPLFTYFAPLTFVLVLSMAKDLFDETKRWIQDRRINNTEYQRLKPDGSFERILSSEITVGTLLRVECNKRVPADLVLLHTSEDTGTCFVRTDQLDGETDWKLRYPTKATLELDTHEIAAAQLYVDCEAPHKDIYAFHGTLLRPGAGREGIDVNNTIWNGCTVASGSVVGLVIHTGVETRAAMNAESSSVKQTLIGKEMNGVGMLCFALLFSLAIGLTILQLNITPLPAGKIVVSIFRFQILLSMIIPISLRVNLDLAKLWYSIMIVKDHYSGVLPGVAVRNTSIAEELGRLHYLFSDKTGTLTKNMMEFRNLHLEDNFSMEDSDRADMKSALGVYFESVKEQFSNNNNNKQIFSGGSLPGAADDSSNSSSIANLNTPMAIATATANKNSNSNNNTHPKRKLQINYGEDEEDFLNNNNNNSTSSTPIRGGREKNKNTNDQPQQQQPQHSLIGFNKKQAQLIGRALLCLALCHQVTPVRDTETGAVEFQAASPDEISMVEFASSCGIVLESRVTLRKQDPETGDLLEGEMILSTEFDSAPRLEYDVLKAFPFSSERKCMGIILRNRVTRQIQYLMKGADVKMIECIPKTDATSWLEDRCGDLARMGRRTLVFAMKDLTLDEYKKFASDLNEANASQSHRHVAVEAAMRNLERQLNLVCLTGVEDQLQDNVVSTLEHLGACGIKVWMLTGDKIETARCIGRSTKLIRSDLIETLVASSAESAIEQLNELHIAYAAHAEAEDSSGQVAHFSAVNWALIIDGKTLQYFIAANSADQDRIDKNLERRFLQVASRADSVVVARCSPTQKAMVVQAIVKYRGPNIRCAAIGDGGNDVSMIRAAHVGFGIEGVEGKQASLAADYSITKFCHCERLITWHGRNSYLRTSQLSQFIIHRGTVYAIIQACFSLIFDGSTQALFNGYLVSLYSAFYTMAPTFALVLNEDRLESDILEFPELYRWLLKGRAFNARSFLQWMWLAVFQGGMLMYLTVRLFADEMFQLVSVAFTGLMFTELFFVGSIMHFSVLWKQRRFAFFLFFAAEAFSLFCYFFSVVILPNTFDNKFFFSAPFWRNTVIISLASIFPVAIIKFIESRIQIYLLRRKTHGARSLFNF